MTEEKRILKSTAKKIREEIAKNMSISEKDRQRFYEHLEISIDIKKNKITISLPYSYFRF